MTSPDPVPAPLGPLAAIVTTEGTTLLATGVTEQEAAVEAPESALPLDAAAGLGLLLVQPATAPARASTATGASRGSHRAVLNFRMVNGIMPSPENVTVPGGRTGTASTPGAAPTSPSRDELRARARSSVRAESPPDSREPPLGLVSRLEGVFVSILGTRVQRVEDPAFLTRGAVYTEDVQDDRLAGAGHVFFVRSPIAHARINSVDLSAARGAAGVIA